MSLLRTNDSFFMTSHFFQGNVCVCSSALFVSSCSNYASCSCMYMSRRVSSWPCEVWRLICWKISSRNRCIRSSYRPGWGKGLYFFVLDSGLCWTSPQVSLSAQWGPYNVCPFYFFFVGNTELMCFRPSMHGKTPVAIWSYTTLRRLYWIRIMEVCSVFLSLFRVRPIINPNLNQAFISKQQAASH